MPLAWTLLINAGILPTLLIIPLHKHLYNLHRPIFFFFTYPCTVYLSCLCLSTCISLVVVHSVCLYISLVISEYMVFGFNKGIRIRL